jgi:hypothetical protein
METGNFVQLFWQDNLTTLQKEVNEWLEELDKRPDYAFQELQTSVTKEGMMIMLRYSGPKMLEHE